MAKTKLNAPQTSEQSRQKVCLSAAVRKWNSLQLSLLGGEGPKEHLFHSSLLLPADHLPAHRRILRLKVPALRHAAPAGLHTEQYLLGSGGRRGAAPGPVPLHLQGVL